MIPTCSYRDENFLAISARSQHVPATSNTAPTQSSIVHVILSGFETRASSFKVIHSPEKPTNANAKPPNRRMAPAVQSATLHLPLL
jgi:hypothetical protein